MKTKIVVLGAGYAGTAAIKQLEKTLTTDDTELIWISDTDYHLVRHEVHRAISTPSISNHLTIPIRDIKSSKTRFIQGEVIGLNTNKREITLADDSMVEFDYVLVCLGSQTAFYSIDGLKTHALTLENHNDALTIRQTVTDAASNSSAKNPAQIIIGGGGFTGIQCAGELAVLRDLYSLPLEISIIDANKNIASHQSEEMQATLRTCLNKHNIEITTNCRVRSINESEIYLNECNSIDYDVFVWTGGITGPDTFLGDSLNHEQGQINVESTFNTDNEYVFAVGDCALIDQSDNSVVPPTAEAAWEGGTVAGNNLARAVQNDSLKSWSYTNNGVLVSIGKVTVAHKIRGIPVTTFSGPVARFCKKIITTKWIGQISSWRYAAKVWPQS